MHKSDIILVNPETGITEMGEAWKSAPDSFSFVALEIPEPCNILNFTKPNFFPEFRYLKRLIDF